MKVQSDDLRNVCVERPSHWGDCTFMELFTQKILDKESLKQKPGASTK